MQERAPLGTKLPFAHQLKRVSSDMLAIISEGSVTAFV